MTQSTFIESHPFRIDLPDGHHVRFRNLFAAARSAAFLKRDVWDEENQRGYSFMDCVRLAAQADHPRAA